jgi:hypothetical protein
VIFSSIATLVHLAIDFGKNGLFRAARGGVDLFSFLTDQLLHIFSLIWLWQTFQFRPNVTMLSFYRGLLAPRAIMVFKQSIISHPAFFWHHFLLGAVIYIYVCFGGAFLIRKALNWIRAIPNSAPGRNASTGGPGTERVGYWIGILERAIIITMVLGNALAAMAFILTAKSIARFSELADRKFAEYYLVGTLMSMILALSGGLFLNFLLAIST